MKPTWKLVSNIRYNCECLICGKKFSFYGIDFFHMKQVKCPTCNQQVWVPKCPNGCSSFNQDRTEDVIKFKDYITEDTTNEEHH